MKRLIVLFIPVFVIFVNNVFPQSRPNEFSYDVVDNRTITITKYNGRATTVQIPDRLQDLPVTAIGDSMFYNNNDLLNIIIPSSVTTIGNNAFSSCFNLTSLIIPSSVTTIGNDAFNSCYGLTSVTIPYSVTIIGNKAFGNCRNLTNIIVDNNNPVFKSVDGVLFDKNVYNLIAYPAGKNTTTYVIPSTVNSIENSSFMHCRNLRNIIVSSEAKSIGAYSFFYCINLTSITLPSSLSIIGEQAFAECSNLSNITIPSSVTTIGDGAFASCSSLTNINLPSSITTIGNETFYRCNNLIKITIPSSVTTIGKFAFSGCVNLNNITIPSSVTTIGEHVFSGCFSFTNITIPSSVITIGNGAFNSCINLITFIVDNKNTKYTSVDGVLFDKDKSNLIAYPAGKKDVNYIIPSTVKVIENWAFYQTYFLTSITISFSVTTIGKFSFAYCTNMTSIIVENHNSNFLSIDGVLFDKKIQNLITYPAGKKTEKYIIPSTVITISDGAFSGCEYLVNITIPFSVTTIGSSVFSDCDNLNSIAIGNNVRFSGFYQHGDFHDVYYRAKQSAGIYIKRNGLWVKE